jgi:hypothetical protein
MLTKFQESFSLGKGGEILESGDERLEMAYPAESARPVRYRGILGRRYGVGGGSASWRNAKKCNEACMWVVLPLVRKKL